MKPLTAPIALGCSPQVVENGVSMSPGEMRKLSLALGMGNFVWALLLDEPTNHLDLQSIERLEEALKAFLGALVLISHDSVFAERCTERVVKVYGEFVELQQVVDNKGNTIRHQVGDELGNHPIFQIPWGASYLIK